MIQPNLLVGILTLVLTGCASREPTLVKVPAQALYSVDFAAPVLTRDHERAVAVSEAIEAGELNDVLQARMALGDAERRHASSRLAVAETEQSLKQLLKGDDQWQIDQTRALLELRQRELSRAQLTLHWRKEDLVREQAEWKVARAEVTLRRAELQLARARILHDHDGVLARTYPINTYEDQVAKATRGWNRARRVALERHDAASNAEAALDDDEL